MICLVMLRPGHKATVGFVVFSLSLFVGVAGLCDVSNCTNTSNCILSADGHSCKCAMEYYGDLCDKVASMKVMCGKNFISITVIEDFFKYYNVSVESLHLANKSCRAHKEVISAVPHYIVRTSKDQYAACGGKPLEKNITHIAYSLTLMSDPNVHENIIRDPTVKIDYTCVYPYMRAVSLPFPIHPFSSETVVRVDELDVTVEMALFKDHTFTDAFSSAPSIHLRDKVYVQVSVTEPKDFFLLNVNECWASQSPKHNETTGLTHPLLLNGCVNDETVIFETGTMSEMFGNGKSSTVRYSFSMFRFVAEPSVVYLHCKVHICAPDEDEPCRPKCKSITKREAAREGPTQGLLSYGPIKIDKTETSTQKSKLVLMLMLPVGAVWVLGLFLLILITFAQAGARRVSSISTIDG
ncbi:zona pellucida glycoprotein d isoform X1 [Alosa sapidissima]|uniref:zona pellucida glycoprotein d isoform X1 n=2 Tax=Alosa sapidissima TaxID=34773 RepID=UPI001C09A709|nr:zona pellucida glycoprotein d isoform X1 [Alosa sapidissima]